jgi:hypothetical protein
MILHSFPVASNDVARALIHLLHHVKNELLAKTKKHAMPFLIKKWKHGVFSVNLSIKEELHLFSLVCKSIFLFWNWSGCNE